MKAKNKSANVMRWIARIFGAVLVVFTLIMVIGEFLESKERHHGVSPFNTYTPIIIAIFIVWGLGLAGLLIGWWKAKFGGFLSLICFILVAILNLFNAESPMQAGTFLVMAIYCIPSILFIAYWRETKH
jgi:hypothetical protein